VDVLSWVGARFAHSQNCVGCHSILLSLVVAKQVPMGTLCFLKSGYWAFDSIFKRIRCQEKNEGSTLSYRHESIN
jgi:hypothetical protein